MRMKPWLAVGLTLVAFGTGCKKKGSDGGGGAASGPSEFAAWTPKDAATLFEGAWLVRMHLQSDKKTYTSMAGEPVALDIKGAKVTAFGGDKEQELSFAIETPCGALLDEPITEGSMKGGVAHHNLMFVVENGKLLVGSGAAGYRKGKTALVCSEGMNGGVTIVDDKGGCVTWDKKFREWEKKTDTCAWEQKDGADVLTIGTGDWKTVVKAQGDVLASDQFRESIKDYVKAKDFADAKAQVTAKLKANDPGEQAKAKGGVAGKTDTVLNLIATFASDPSLKGKAVEITAQYNGDNSSTSNGETTYSMVLIDSKDASDLSIYCDLGKTKGPEGLVQYDKVIAKGTVGEAFGKPELEGCMVTKAP
ncbi:MAG: hypothetical protein AB7T06_44070 [Kofleriaceae bacterium]